MVVSSWSDHRGNWRDAGFSNDTSPKISKPYRRVTVVGAGRSIRLSYNRTPILIAHGEPVIDIIADSSGKCK